MARILKFDDIGNVLRLENHFAIYLYALYLAQTAQVKFIGILALISDFGPHYL